MSPISYKIQDQRLVVLLCGGDKRTQNDDIERAIAYRTDYLLRLKEGENG